MKYSIFCGSKETMQNIANRKARALNPKTMRWQVIDSTALYKVVPDPKSDLLYWLTSNKDLTKIAKVKGLII